MEIPRDAAHMQRMYGPGQPIPPLFSPTANSVTLDLPWPDFSFFPPLPNPKCGKRCTHPLKTPRWQLAHPELLALGRKSATAGLGAAAATTHFRSQARVSTTSDF